MSKKLFNFVIGNPPFQEDTKDTSDKPVYNYLIDAAYNVAEKVELIHPARFLFNAGKTPKAWNEKMLNDPHLKVLFYEQVSGNVFPNTDIKGGVAITYRDDEKNFGPIETFSQFSELNNIKEKVESAQGFTTLDNIIVQQNRWKLETLYNDFPEFKQAIGSNGTERRLTTPILSSLSVFKDMEEPGDLKIIGLIKNRRCYKFVSKKYIDESHENLFKFKVLLPASNGSGAIGEVLSTPLVGEPLVGEPLVGYTQSFIGIGAFDTREEAEACLKYVKSKFSRTMLGILKITQHNHKGTWRYVPLQDFTEKSDIDWSKNVHEIDIQLYKKYGLDEREIEFIETHVKEME